MDGDGAHDSKSDRAIMRQPETYEGSLSFLSRRQSKRPIHSAMMNHHETDWTVDYK